VENDNSARFESVYSTKLRAGRRRTYFFDVRKTKGGDFYITLTESTKKFNGDGYDRHKIFLYKEDFNRFMNSLNDTVDHVKNDLMPDYDYEQYERRQEEWEAKMAEEAANGGGENATHTEEASAPTAESAESSPAEDAPTTDVKSEPDVKSEDDMAW
jgi:hypothetical protein